MAGLGFLSESGAEAAEATRAATLRHGCDRVPCPQSDVMDGLMGTRAAAVRGPARVAAARTSTTCMAAKVKNKQQKRVQR